MAMQTNNTCCGNEAGLVQKFIGTAYDVVKTVYENLGEIQFIYDFLHKYGVLITIDSIEALKALPTDAKYTRVYSYSSTLGYSYTDYLYVDGNASGIIPDDPNATGSWIVVATSGQDGSSGSGGYIPLVYNQGSAVGGETTIAVPPDTIGVPFIVIEGLVQYVGYGFTFDVATLTITLAQPLEAGDEVVLLLSGTPAVPDNPNISDWVTINWLYNGGYAVGGEQVIAIPYTFESIPSIFKNGLRYHHGLTTQSYTVDAANQRILLTEPLATNDRLVVQIGGERTIVEMSDRTIQELARSSNVKDNEVILSTNTTQYLNDMKVIYDEVAQKSYGLPTLPTNVYILSVSNGQLTYAPGNITVDLLPIPTDALNKINGFIEDLASPVGYSYVGSCASVSALRAIEPTYDNQIVNVLSHTDGYNYGGGKFRAVLAGSGYTDNNGTVIKTAGNAVWLRETKNAVHATDFGLITNDNTKATSNAAAIVAAANNSFTSGSTVLLPSGIIYVDNMVFDYPITIKGSHPGSGASLLQREQSSDLIHTGNSYCFDFPPKLRPNVLADTQSVVDGIRILDMNIRGTNAGLGGIRVNTAASIGTVGYERRNTTFMNVTISGYYSGWGYELFNTFTNHLHNVTVWDCAAPYYIRTAHSTDHISCVYENCAWGCLAINTESNNHIGGAIEGFRYLSKMTKPIDYDENGNFPTDTGYTQLYAGIGMRTRGGTTNLYGVYLEANKIDLHLEDSCKITMRDCYVNSVTGRTDYTAIGTSGRLVVQNCRFVGTPARERWHPNSGSLLCSHAIIIQNHFASDASRPTATPTISNIGEFDVYSGIPDTNAATRINKGQGSYTTVQLSSNSLNVDNTVILAGLTTTVPTVTGTLYVDSTGVVKRKQ